MVSFDFPDDTNLYFAMTLESVSQGHENWVYGLHWQPAQKSNGKMD